MWWTYGVGLATCAPKTVLRRIENGAIPMLRASIPAMNSSNVPTPRPTRTLLVPLFTAMCLVGIAACGPTVSEAPLAESGGTTTGNTPRTAVGFSQFSDIAVPAGAKMDVDRSLVLGARDEWIGRLSLTAGDNATAAYDFFLVEMPKFGWQEITSVRSEVSVLSYSRGERVATVQIRARTLGGSLVDVTVSPRGRPPQVSSPTSSGNGVVTSSPLR